ncbi:MAG: glycosyltransferase family 9 protein, partial [Bryobacteraceae bacterium]
MAFNPAAFERISIRSTNWLGDAVMSLPAIRVIRQVCPRAEVALVARPWVAELYARESSINRVIPCPRPKTLGERRAFAAGLRAERFDAAFLLPNSFDAALMAWLARIPERIGYARDGRSWLLTRAIPRPEPGDIPRHERFYYLELLRRAGLIEHFPEPAAIRLEGIPAAREAGIARLRALGVEGAAIGVSPGAAYG